MQDSVTNVESANGQYVLIDYDGDYSTVGPFDNTREAKAFASGINFIDNDVLRVLGIMTKDQLLVNAKIIPPVFLKNK